MQTVRELTKKYPPECELGYTADQVTHIIGAAHIDEFWHWMRGQTMAYCVGERYDYEEGKTVESCGGVSHHTVVYPHDLWRYTARLPITD